MKDFGAQVSTELMDAKSISSESLPRLPTGRADRPGDNSRSLSARRRNSERLDSIHEKLKSIPEEPPC